MNCQFDQNAYFIGNRIALAIATAATKSLPATTPRSADNLWGSQRAPESTGTETDEAIG